MCETYRGKSSSALLFAPNYLSSSSLYFLANFSLLLIFFRLDFFLQNSDRLKMDRWWHKLTSKILPWFGHNDQFSCPVPGLHYCSLLKCREKTSRKEGHQQVDREMSENHRLAMNSWYKTINKSTEENLHVITCKDRNSSCCLKINNLHQEAFIKEEK